MVMLMVLHPRGVIITLGTMTTEDETIVHTVGLNTHLARIADIARVITQSTLSHSFFLYRYYKAQFIMAKPLHSEGDSKGGGFRQVRGGTLTLSYNHAVSVGMRV